MAARKQSDRKQSELKQQVAAALAAAEDKKAEQVSVLELDKAAGGFTDYFVICSGTNPRQIQAIADDVELRLKKVGLHPLHVEGYKQAEWVLLDYFDFVVHVFSDQARRFYDLERLWKSAKRIEPGALKPSVPKKRTASSPTPASAKAKPAPRKAAAKKAAGGAGTSRPRARARKSPSA
jgi:ribosome-associated protein